MINQNLYEKIENTDGTITYKPYDISNVKICGKTIEQIVKILNGLDIEKESKIILTMENLEKYYKLIKHQYRIHALLKSDGWLPLQDLESEVN